MNRNVSIIVQAWDKASGVFGKIGNSAGSLRSKFSQLAASATSFQGLLGAGAFGLGVKEAIQAYADDERSLVKLQAVLKATGGAAGLSADGIAKMASELQRSAGIADDVTVNAAAKLATFTKVSGSVFKEAIVLAQDMATTLDSDLNAAVLQLGKALQDPVKGVTALTRSGVSFDASQKAMIKSLVESNDLLGAQQVILAELKKEFGGVTEAIAGTTSGKLTDLKNAIGDLAEAIGSNLAPAVERVTKIVQGARDLITGGAPAANIPSPAQGAVASMGKLNPLGIPGYRQNLLAQKDALAKRMQTASGSEREGLANQAQILNALIDAANQQESQFNKQVLGGLGGVAKGFLGPARGALGGTAVNLKQIFGGGATAALGALADAKQGLGLFALQRAFTPKPAKKKFVRGPAAEEDSGRGPWQSPGLGASESRYLAYGSGVQQSVMKENRQLELQKQQNREVIKELQLLRKAVGDVAKRSGVTIEIGDKPGIVGGGGAF